jgi:hypothetical protein
METDTENKCKNCKYLIKINLGVGQRCKKTLKIVNSNDSCDKHKKRKS